jgi:hypothetical protein
VVEDKLEKLIDKRQALNAKIRQELGRTRSRKRREDTRRKILAGAIVLTEKDPTIKTWLQRTLDKVLTRNDERALFGLVLLPEPPPGAPLQPDAPSAFGKRAPASKVARQDEPA